VIIDSILLKFFSGELNRVRVWEGKVEDQNLHCVDSSKNFKTWEVRGELACA
jgi:hypothetical protein